MTNEIERNDRREFLKKAGTVAWVVPAMSAVNMTAAMAGTDGTTGSVVVTTAPPSTTEGPQCSCALELKDVGFEEDTFVYFIHLDVGNGCDGAAYSRFTLHNNEVFDFPIAEREFEYRVPDELNEVSLLCQILDANMNELARCSTTLRPPAGRAQRAGNGGRGRFSISAR